VDGSDRSFQDDCQQQYDNKQNFLISYRLYERSLYSPPCRNKVRG